MGLRKEQEKGNDHCILETFKLMVASLRYRFCSGGKSLVRTGYGNYSVDLNPF